MCIIVSIQLTVLYHLQKIRTIELDGKTIKLQIVSTLDITRLSQPINRPLEVAGYWSYVARVGSRTSPNCPRADPG